MREIKFRAWDKKNKQIAYPLNITWRCGEIDCVHHSKDHKGGVYLFNGKDCAEFEIMQFTGLHDKNGEEIYEGDIVSPIKEFKASVGNNKYEVYYHQGRFGIAYPNSIHYALNHFQLTGTSVSEIQVELEVIGNIYEHSHLLK